MDDIRGYVRIARKRWLSIVMCTVIGGVLGLAYGLSGADTYSSKTELFVAIGGVSSGSAAYGGSTFTLQRVKSYVDLVDSPATLEPVIEELGLTMPVRQLAGMVSASNPPQTVLLEIRAVGPSPDLVAAIANHTAMHYARAIEVLETPAGGTSPIKVTQTRQAVVSWEAMPRHIGLKFLVGLVLGLAAGFGQALLRERFDTTVHAPAELSEAAGAPALAWIAVDDDPLIALDQTSPGSEGYRTLRTNLAYIDVDHPPRVVAVTSAEAGEGRTTLACNLAVVLAQAGRRVCLVEADLRRAAASRVLGLEASVGLTDVLAGRVELSSALVRWRRGLLTVLPAGFVPPNPSELLGSAAYAQVFASLRRRFEVVVVDAAPLLPVADGALAALGSDGALLVGRYGVTSARSATDAAAALDRVGARLLGVVLNAVPAAAGTGARSDFGYGYGYEYEPDDRPTDVVDGHLDQMLR